MKTLSFIKTVAKDSAKLLVIDYETFFSRHDHAGSQARLTHILGRLTARTDIEVVMVSEHDNKYLSRLSELMHLQVISEHGALIKKDGKWQSHIETDSNWKSQMFPVLIEYSLRCQGTHVEEKPYSLCWHFKDTKDKKLKKILPELLEELGWYQSKFNLKIIQHKKMVEILPNNLDKGIAILRLLQENKFDYVIALADEKRGGDVFKALMPLDQCITVKVGTGYTEAKHSVDNIEESLFFLENI